MTPRERADIWIEAARHARENARDHRHTASTWPSEHPDWVADNLAESHRAFQRAYGYLQQARYLRSYQ
jgi:hypothetical protein